MFKATNILNIDHYQITCRLNEKFVRTIDMLPILEHHKNLNGIDKLMNFQKIKEVKIGLMGELYWENIINTDDEVLDYDVSPEFTYFN
jgi:hypothetical protein